MIYNMRHYETAARRLREEVTILEAAASRMYDYKMDGTIDEDTMFRLIDRLERDKRKALDAIAACEHAADRIRYACSKIIEIEKLSKREKELIREVCDELFDN